MTDAQILIQKAREILAAPLDARINPARRVAKLSDGLERLADALIPDFRGNHAVRLYRCADGSFFAVAKNPSGECWSLPAFWPYAPT